MLWMPSVDTLGYHCSHGGPGSSGLDCKCIFIVAGVMNWLNVSQDISSSNFAMAVRATVGLGQTILSLKPFILD